MITKGWVKTGQNEGNSSSEHEDYMLSIDCEMVVCEDGEREVVRACVVNSDCKVSDWKVDVIIRFIKNVFCN